MLSEERRRLSGQVGFFETHEGFRDVEKVHGDFGDGGLLMSLIMICSMIVGNSI